MRTQLYSAYKLQYLMPDKKMILNKKNILLSSVYPKNKTKPQQLINKYNSYEYVP